ncbi:MAG: glycosyltransferase [Pseudomonadota bacterium]
MSEPPGISVIIPVFNDAGGLARCLDALARQTDAAPFEVIVVDNGSDPPLDPATLPALPSLRLIRETVPGSYAARNAGIAAARASVLAFTDADCRPRPDWLAAGHAAIDALGGTEAPGAIGGRIQIFPARAEAPRPAELYEAALMLDQADYVARGFAATANMWTTTATMRAVGPFDATLQSGGDAEWGRRVFAAGAPLRYDAATVIDHPARDSIGALYRKLRRVRSTAAARDPVESVGRRGLGAKLGHFRARTEGWPLGHRLRAFAVAALMEALRPVADLDLRLRRSRRL